MDDIDDTDPSLIEISSGKMIFSINCVTQK